MKKLHLCASIGHSLVVLLTNIPCVVGIFRIGRHGSRCSEKNGNVPGLLPYI